MNMKYRREATFSSPFTSTFQYKIKHVYIQHTIVYEPDDDQSAKQKQKLQSKISREEEKITIF